MAILQSCCCWRSVRKGSYACAYYTMGYFTLNAAMISKTLHEELIHLRGNFTNTTRTSFLDADTTSEVSLVFTILFLSISSSGILASFMLVYGIYRNQKILFIPWMVTFVMFIITDISHCLYVFIEHTLKWNPANGILFTLDFFVGTLNVYALLCVISQYQELKAGRGRAEDEQNQRIPNVQYSAQPTATSYLSSRRPITYNETRASPTQSPTGTGPHTSLGIEEPSPNLLNKGPRKSVKFPDHDSPTHNGKQLLEPPWTIDVKSQMLLTKGTDTAPLINSTEPSAQPTN